MAFNYADTQDSAHSVSGRELANPEFVDDDSCCDCARLDH
jgi:hypothetical protein